MLVSSVISSRYPILSHPSPSQSIPVHPIPIPIPIPVPSTFLPSTSPLLPYLIIVPPLSPIPRASSPRPSPCALGSNGGQRLFQDTLASYIRTANLDGGRLRGDAFFNLFDVFSGGRNGLVGFDRASKCTSRQWHPLLFLVLVLLLLLLP